MYYNNKHNLFLYIISTQGNTADRSNIVLHNEEVWSNTIYSSNEASGVNHIIQMICFQWGRSPSWKHAVPLHLWVM